MQQNNVIANTVNFIGTTTAGQGYQSTAPASMDDYFVPANFCPTSWAHDHRLP